MKTLLKHSLLLIGCAFASQSAAFAAEETLELRRLECLGGNGVALTYSNGEKGGTVDSIWGFARKPFKVTAFEALDQKGARYFHIALTDNAAEPAKATAYEIYLFGDASPAKATYLNGVITQTRKVDETKKKTTFGLYPIELPENAQVVTGVTCDFRYEAAKSRQ